MTTTFLKMSRHSIASFILITGFTLLLFSSCKKDKEDTVSPFQPAGFWMGNAYIDHTAILNRESGSSRLYIGIPADNDTSSAVVLKVDGTYTYLGGKFISTYFNAEDSFFLRSNSVSENEISGLIFKSQSAFHFEFRKQ